MMIMDLEHGEANGRIVEMKERRNLKVLVVLATTFMVLVGAMLRGTPYYQGTNSSFLFEQRSLQGLLGMCSKENRFEQVDFPSTTTGVTIAQGETKQYRTTVPKGTEPNVSVQYGTGGKLSLLTSYLREKPTIGTDNDVSCAEAGPNGPFTIKCGVEAELRDRQLFIWIVGDAASTFTLKVGDPTYV